MTTLCESNPADSGILFLSSFQKGRDGVKQVLAPSRHKMGRRNMKQRQLACCRATGDGFRRPAALPEGAAARQTKAAETAQGQCGWLGKGGGVFCIQEEVVQGNPYSPGSTGCDCNTHRDTGIHASGSSQHANEARRRAKDTVALKSKSPRLQSGVSSPRTRRDAARTTVSARSLLVKAQ
jgi:hypothetical protein